MICKPTQPIQPKDTVRIAPWVLTRRKLTKRSKVAKAKGTVLSIGDGPHGPEYARIEWSSDILTHHWEKLSQIEKV